MLEAGGPLHHEQAVLGHADAKTTSGYLNATLQHPIDSMRRFGSGSQPLHELAQGAQSEPPPVVQANESAASKPLVTDRLGVAHRPGRFSQLARP
jgi:hypothetical protein